MSNAVGRLLTHLEEVTAKAFDATDTARHDTLDPERALALIEERGVLIAELNDALRTAEPVSYTEWNRFVIMQYQGNGIQANLLGLRSQAVLALADNARAQAFIERLTGAVWQGPEEHLSETA
jgi:hypothetical protein